MSFFLTLLKILSSTQVLWLKRQKFNHFYNKLFSENHQKIVTHRAKYDKMNYAVTYLLICRFITIYQGIFKILCLFISPYNLKDF
jgi:hypothetical protein